MREEDVYQRILSRVQRDELTTQCNQLIEKDLRSLARRQRGAQRALQHAADVSAAARALDCRATSSTEAQQRVAALVSDIEQLQSLLMSRIVRCAKSRSPRGDAWAPQSPGSAATSEAVGSGAATASPTKGKKRRLPIAEDAVQTTGRDKCLRADPSTSSEQGTSESPECSATPDAQDDHAKNDASSRDIEQDDDPPIPVVITDSSDDSPGSPVELDLPTCDVDVEPPSCYEEARRLQAAPKS
ncbi:hypothetical protein PINS_up008788 [Pythium insidiosum]|nr:hypothetical protein PINS_up008788 [Pythium insidiosum]